MMSSIPRSRLSFNFTACRRDWLRSPPSQSQLQAGAPRCAFDLRHLSQHLLDMTYHTVGFLQRTARRHDVVENESALVHFRKQIGARKAVANVGGNDQNSAEQDEQPGAFECTPQPAFVEVHNAQEKAAEMLFLRGQ